MSFSPYEEGGRRVNDYRPIPKSKFSEPNRPRARREYVQNFQINDFAHSNKQRRFLFDSTGPRTEQERQAEVEEMLNQMNQAQLLDLLAQSKALLEKDPESVRRLLSAYPALSYALLHMELVVNLVEVPVVKQVVAKFARR